MEPGRWYTASSPLQSVVAGDMYLPTAGARQNTELFRPITFANGTNDRFNPAVYQRGWDKGKANAFELPSASSAEGRNVAVSLDWSDVYNDVCEQYSAGRGFSVKTDGDVTLRVDNTSCVDGFCLVDRRTDYVEPITEGLEYTVHGDVAGRLYISSHDYSLSYSQERITIKVTNDVVCAAAAGNMHVDLCIYDLTGKPVAKASGDNGFAEVCGLYRGFYIVEASTPTGLRTLEKICMK